MTSREIEFDTADVDLNIGDLSWKSQIYLAIGPQIYPLKLCSPLEKTNRPKQPQRVTS